MLDLVFNEQGNVVDFVFVEVNPAYEKQTGIKAANIVGKRKKENAPAAEQRWYDYAIQAAESGKTLQYEYYNDKVNRYFETQFIPISTNQIAVLFKDITELKKNSEILKKKQQEFDHILNSSPIIIFYKDKEGKFIQVNRAFAESLKIPKEKLLGTTVFDLYSAEIARSMANDDFAVLQSKSPKLGIVEPYESPTGLRWIRTNKVPILDENGVATGLIGFSEDITERKKAEDSLKQTEKKLLDIIDQSPVVFEVYDKEGFLFQVNPAWDKLWQVPRECALGKYNILQSKQVIENEWLPYFQRAYAGETVTLPDLEYDASLEPEACGYGRKRWISTITYPIRTESGDVNIVVLHEDITEQKILEKQLQDNERMAAIGQTASMVGHDIRNPLQAIVSELFLARQVMAEAPKTSDTSEALESINLIQEQVDYITKIVSDLQDFARPLNPEYANVDLSDLLVSVFETIVVQDQIKVKVDIQGTIKLKTDPTFIKRALTNLVNNAIQAMPDGGELMLTAHKQESNVIITVSDTGKGIPESVKVNLFKPLMTTKAKGQGLGLSVVKRLIEALNGKISFESEEGKGTIFTIGLPTQG